MRQMSGVKAIELARQNAEKYDVTIEPEAWGVTVDKVSGSYTVVPNRTCGACFVACLALGSLVPGVGYLDDMILGAVHFITGWSDRKIAGVVRGFDGKGQNATHAVTKEGVRIGIKARKQLIGE